MSTERHAGSAEGLPAFFVAGFQKCATTWLHDCLRAHPQVYVPDRHMLHFFDIHFEAGLEWYRRQYAGAPRALAIGDTTASYARAPLAPQRIAEYAPDARFVFAVRNPVDRAFSHYWHEKKKGRFDYSFEELFENYDLFESWVATGFYHLHIRRFLEHFPMEQLLVLVVEEIEAVPESALVRLFTFLGVDPDTRPRCTHQRSNRAWPYAVPWRGRHPLARMRSWWRDSAGRRQRPPPSEYERGMEAATREKLELIFAPHNRALGDVLDRSFDPWPCAPAERMAS